MSTYWTTDDRRFEGTTAEQVLNSFHDDLIENFEILPGQSSLYSGKQYVELLEIDEDGNELRVLEAWASVVDCGIYRSAE